MVSLKVTVQPICEPVDLGTVKNHLKVPYDDDDALISLYIQAAREWCESYVNRSFIKKTYQMTLSWLPLFDYRMQGWVAGTAPNPGWYNGLWVADSLKIKLFRPNLIPGSSTHQVHRPERQRADAARGNRLSSKRIQRARAHHAEQRRVLAMDAIQQPHCRDDHL